MSTHPCPCNSCRGLKYFSTKTIYRHCKRSSAAEDHTDTDRKRQCKASGHDDEDFLHNNTDVTSFQLAIRVLTICNKFAGVTQQCVGEILNLISDILGGITPKNKVPRDYNELINFMSGFMTPVARYFACPAECRLFIKDKGRQHGCQKDGCKDKPGKVYHYIPLIDRLRQLYANPTVAKSLQQHMEPAEDGDVADIQQSQAWRELYGGGGRFDGDFRAISLEFSSDGFSPFHHSTSKPYSIEQQASVILNLPPDMRTKPGFVLLHGLIPGPTAPKDGKHDIYLTPLVDELLQLSEGVPGVYDAHRQETFTLRAEILLHIHDFPGQAKVFHGMGTGAKFACPMCKSEGCHCKHMSKMIYRSGREFLEEHDLLRKDTSFPGGGVELGLPKLRDFAEDTALAATSGAIEEAIRTSVPRSADRKTHKTAHAAVMSKGGRKRLSEFDRLGDREAAKIAVEGMHTVQGVAKNLHGILNGHRDTVGVRAHETSLKRFPGCEADDRNRLPPAPFTLSREDMKVADGRMRTITVPNVKGTLPNAAFANFHSMKSHTWHLMLAKGVYPYVLRGLLETSQRNALMSFAYIVSICTARVVHGDLMPRVKRQLHRRMVIMDKEFPETLKTILWHLLHHLPMFLERYGPICSYWMFYFERQIHHHVSRLHNKKHPEASIINSYRTDAMITLMNYAHTSQTAQQSRESSDTSEGTAFDIKTCSRGKWTWKGGDDGSLVFTRDERGIVVFGRILEFYNYSYEGRQHSCASVKWYGDSREDQATRLYTVKTDSPDEHPTLNPAVPVEDLSEPLIFAEEEDEEEDTSTLFVLDFLDRTRMVEILDWMEGM